MHYKSVQILSHPRSGSHYLTALIAKNFFKTDDYLSFYGGHGFNFQLMEQRIKNKNNTLFIYIKRNLEDTLKSIFSLRSRFGLDVDDFKVFKSTPYNQMWNGSLKVDVVRKTLLSTDFFNSVDPLFRKINKTPEEFHKIHYKFWTELYLKYSNTFIICYDSLKANYLAILRTLKLILDIDHISLNIDQKIGWEIRKEEIK